MPNTNQTEGLSAPKTEEEAKRSYESPKILEEVELVTFCEICPDPISFPKS